MSYAALAPVYDELTADVDYAKRAVVIDRIFQKNQISGIVLDAGCGTGTLTLLLAKKGYDMIGADGSAEMLSVAHTKMAKLPDPPTLIHQNLVLLNLYGTVSAVVCMQDTINHIGPDLDEVLYRFSLFTEPGGLLVFDINTPYKHEEILRDNTFVYEFRDGICVWQNRHERLMKRIQLKVDVFLRCADGLYRRETDVFTEYTIEPQKMEKLLQNAGYCVLEVSDGDTYGPVTATTQRIMYVARKQ